MTLQRQLWGVMVIEHGVCSSGPMDVGAIRAVRVVVRATRRVLTLALKIY